MRGGSGGDDGNGVSGKKDNINDENNDAPLL